MSLHIRNSNLKLNYSNKASIQFEFRTGIFTHPYLVDMYHVTQKYTKWGIQLLHYTMRIVQDKTQVEHRAQIYTKKKCLHLKSTRLYASSENKNKL